MQQLPAWLRDWLPASKNPPYKIPNLFPYFTSSVEGRSQLLCFLGAVFVKSHEFSVDRMQQSATEPSCMKCKCIIKGSLIATKM